MARKKEFNDVKLPSVESIPGEAGIPLLSQELQSRFFSPHTNFTSGLLFHGMGTGKCVLPGTKISTSLGDFLIEKLWEKEYSKFDFDDGEGGLWSRPRFDIFVPSFNGKEFHPNLIKKLYRQLVYEPIVSITLENGSNIQITQAHKLFNGEEWINNFKIGDDIAIPNEKYEVFRNLFKENSLVPDMWSKIDIDYSKIISIDKKIYRGCVYDLEINKVHNYVANNILCHNTCTSSLIVENFKSSLVDGKPREPAIVIVPNTKIVRLYRKEVMDRCTREGIYIPQKNPNELRQEKKGTTLKMTEMTLERRLKAAIEKSYRIVTLETFLFRKFSVKDSEGNIIEIRDEKKIPRDPNLIRKFYSNRVIIIDEAHKIRETSTKKKGDILQEKQYEEMHRFLHAVEGCRIILLTGTPIWDQVHEIASLMNLILPEHEQLPTGKAFMREFFNNKKDLDPEKSKLLRTRFRGRISFLRQMVTTASKEEIGTKTPWLKYITVYPSAMSNFQYEYAKKSRSEVKTVSITYKSKTGENIISSRNIKGGALSMTARDASTFVFPVFSKSNEVIGGSYGNAAYSDNIKPLYKGRSYTYSNPETKKVIKENLWKYSSKFAAIIKEINDHPNELVFIYNEFIVGGGGSINLALVLEAHGFVWARDFTGIRKVDPRGRKRFTVITSDTATIRDDKQVAKFLESFNKPDNKYGERCQIIIGSETIGTGITIKNVRQVHVVTPHWTIPAIDQALGRVIRVGSHKSLPEEERNIRIYRHISVKEYEKGIDKVEYHKGSGFPPNVGFSNEETMDVHIYSIAEEKDYFNAQVYRLLKEISWDCPLTYERNVLEGDIDGTRACDYKKCNYKCDNFPEKYINTEGRVWNYDIPPEDILKNTYNNFYSNEELNKMVHRIINLFGVYFSLRFDMIGNLISIDTHEEKISY